MLDYGGLRRTTLRGCTKLTKRHLTAAMTYNLSLLMRTLFRVGTPKQAMAGAPKRLWATVWTLYRLLTTVAFTFSHLVTPCDSVYLHPARARFLAAERPLEERKWTSLPACFQPKLRTPRLRVDRGLGEHGLERLPKGDRRKVAIARDLRRQRRSSSSR